MIETQQSSRTIETEQSSRTIETEQSSRDAILARIRQAKDTHSEADSWSRPNDKQDALQRPRPVDPAAFISAITEAGATLSRVASHSEVVRVIHEYVIQHQLNSTITMSKDPDLTALDWEDMQTSVDYEPRTLTVAVNMALFGIAETSTLVMASSPSNPTGMSFLPDHHLVVLNRSSIVATMEDLWRELRQHQGGMPRSVNLISGPSRTADIEQTIQIGVHGPRYLHVILIDN